MDTALNEAASLLARVGRASVDPTTALHALAAADALHRSAAPDVVDRQPSGTDRVLLERAITLLADLAARRVDEDLLEAIEHALLAHQAAR